MLSAACQRQLSVLYHSSVNELAISSQRCLVLMDTTLWTVTWRVTWLSATKGSSSSWLFFADVKVSRYLRYVIFDGYCVIRDDCNIQIPSCRAVWSKHLYLLNITIKSSTSVPLLPRYILEVRVKGSNKVKSLLGVILPQVKSKIFIHGPLSRRCILNVERSVFKLRIQKAKAVFSPSLRRLWSAIYFNHLEWTGNHYAKSNNAVDRWAVTFGTARRGLSGAAVSQSPCWSALFTKGRHNNRHIAV